MAMPDGQVSCGAGLYYGDAPPAPPNWQEIIRVIDINIDGVTVTATDMSHLRSLYCAKEFKPGMADGGSVSFTLNFVATVFSTVYGLIQQYKSFRVATPNGSSMDFEGFITSLGMAIPEDDRITVPATFKVSGLPAFYVTTPA